MTYRLDDTFTRENCHVFDVFYDEQTKRVFGRGPHDSTPKENPFGTTTGVITCGIRPVLGSDQRHINNSTLIQKRGGDTKMMAGESIAVKVIRTVVFLDGIEDAKGNPIERVTDKVFPTLRNDLIKEIHAEIMEYNHESVEDDDEEGGETGES